MNRYEHLIGGGICGFLLPELLERSGITVPVNKDIVSRLIYAASGAFGGILPDILEPATDPNHREFFHSLVMGIGTIYGLVAKGNINIEALKQNPLFWSVVAGYLSHLGLDFTTPSSLPLY